MKGFRSRPLPLIGLMASFSPYGVMRGVRGMRGMGGGNDASNARWTLIERARDIPLTGLRHRFDKIDTTRWPYSRGMNALTDPEIAEIAAKVGRPRSTDNGKIALDVERIRAMRKA